MLFEEDLDKIENCQKIKKSPIPSDRDNHLVAFLSTSYLLFTHTLNFNTKFGFAVSTVLYPSYHLLDLILLVNQMLHVNVVTYETTLTG